MAEPQTKGEQFEEKASELLRLMGYRIERDKLTSHGRQIDLYAEGKVGAFNLRFSVECKCHKKKVGTGHVDSFHAKIKPLFDNNDIDKGVMISTVGFTNKAKATAKSLKIECKTYDELLSELIDFDHYLDCIIKDYEEDELSKYYVDLDVERRTGYSAPSESVEAKVWGPIDNYIDQWLHTEGKNHISILGEYGTGKTSFCRKYAHNLALRYKEHPISNRIPILINLRDYSKAMNMRQLITDLLINEYNLENAKYSTFERMNKEGLFVLLFDGFDEMAQKVDYNVSVQNFNELSRVVEEKSKVILTCRDEYFRTDIQAKEIFSGKEDQYIKISDRPNFEIIHLRDFTEEKIELYLQKRAPEKWNEYYDQIQETYNLIELARRPVLLDIIVRSLPQLIAKDEPINQGKLYEVYTDEWLDRDFRHGRTFIPKGIKTRLMMGLALRMYVEGKMTVHYTEIPNIIKEYFRELKEKEAKDLEYHRHDVLTCSYLNRDNEGNYKFAHRSFIEFLVAKKFAQDLKDDYKDDFGKKRITKEVMLFFGSLIDDKDKLYDWIKFTATTDYKSKGEDYLGCNAMTVLGSYPENLKEDDFSNTVLKGTDFENTDLTNKRFTNATLKDAKFRNTILKGTNFRKANLQNTAFEEMGAVFTVTFSPDGKCLASGGADSLVHIWEVQKENGRFIRLAEKEVLKGHTDSVSSLVFSPRAELLASGSYGANIILWNVKSWRRVVLKGHGGHVHTVAFSPGAEVLASGGAGETIIIWDTKTYKERHLLKGHVLGPVRTVAFSPHEGLFASGGYAKSVILWDVKNYEKKRVWNEHGWTVNSVAFSPLGGILASGSEDGTVILWDTKKCDKKEVLKAHIGHVNSVAFSPQGGLLASGSNDNTVILWDAKKHVENSVLKGHLAPVNSVAFGPQGQLLASGSDDRTIRIWDVETGECLQVVEQKMNCSGMNITGVTGLTTWQVEFLKERGAIVD